MFLTEREVALLLRRSQSTIARWRREGRLPYIPGRPVLIDSTDIQTLKNTRQWHDQTKAPASNSILPDSMKSDGRKTGDPSAFRLGREKWRKRNAS